MPFSISKPSIADIESTIESRADADWTYSDVGLTEHIHDEMDDRIPKGFDLDHNRILLGRGIETFQSSKQAVLNWKMFDVGWVKLYGPAGFSKQPPVKVGTVVAVLGKAGFWSLNPCRIVYLIDRTGTKQKPNVSQFGFGYGTLPGHLEKGEERFMVEYDSVRDEVWYDLLAFSKPNSMLASLGYPLVRKNQKAFARDSKAAMYRACNEPV